MSAIELGLEWNTQPYVAKDSSYRQFIVISPFSTNPADEEKDFDELERFIDRFFEIFDASTFPEQKP